MNSTAVGYIYYCYYCYYCLFLFAYLTANIKSMLIDLTFYVQFNTKYIILETFFSAKKKTTIRGLPQAAKANNTL